MNTFTFKGVEYDVTWQSKDTQHGGPFDRGSADSYYNRVAAPHYNLHGTSMSPRVDEADMTPEQVDAYYAGYHFNEEYGAKKDYL